MAERADARQCKVCNGEKRKAKERGDGAAARARRRSRKIIAMPCAAENESIGTHVPSVGKEAHMTKVEEGASPEIGPGVLSSNIESVIWRSSKSRRSGDVRNQDETRNEGPKQTGKPPARSRGQPQGPGLQRPAGQP